MRWLLLIVVWREVFILFSSLKVCSDEQLVTGRVHIIVSKTLTFRKMEVIAICSCAN